VRFTSSVISFIDAAFFSDSFVLSTASPETHLFHLVRETGYLCRYLLLQGFPCRGAIATGSLYHNNHFVVGPALVEAYCLERSVAVYPRVVLDNSTVEWWKHEFRLDEDGQGCGHQQCESLVKQDRDGQYFIDIFNPRWTEFFPWTDFMPAAASLPSDPEAFCEEAMKRIAAGRSANVANCKIVAKYQWLAAECEERASALVGLRS